MWQVILDVEDSSFGIAEEEVSKVFSVFEQTERGMQAAEGTGFGMSISREYARMIKSDITITNELG